MAYDKKDLSVFMRRGHSVLHMLFCSQAAKRRIYYCALRYDEAEWPDGEGLTVLTDYPAEWDPRYLQLGVSVDTGSIYSAQ